MLQFVTDDHDRHHEHAERNSAAKVARARTDGKVHILLAASGSVAAIKLPQIIGRLADRHGDHISIRVVLTSSAARFLAGQSGEQPTLSALSHMAPCVDAVYTDTHEWEPAWRRGMPILHIELRKWADIMVVAPLSANTLAKVVNGMCPDLLTSIIRAWDTTGDVDGRQRKILMACAMNTAMWRHPITARQLRVLEEEWGSGPDVATGAGSDPDVKGAKTSWIRVLRPIEKTLACGDVGEGAMMAWEDIVTEIERELGLGESDE